MIGNLNAEGAHEPHLIELSREMKTPDAVTVQQKVIQLSSNVGLLSSEEAFNKVRLFLTDGASYCTSAGREKQNTFPKMEHITCFSHMLARVLYAIKESSPTVTKMVKSVTKFFHTSTRRVSDWSTVCSKKYLTPVERR